MHSWVKISLSKDNAHQTIRTCIQTSIRVADPMQNVYEIIICQKVRL